MRQDHNHPPPLVRRSVLFACLGLVASSLPTKAYAGDEFLLSWPVACDIGQTCFVQSFFDHDSSDGAKDFTCGSRTYNGHDGTDIRLLDAQAERAGVQVLAAAAGRVLRIRDGVSDVSIRITGKAAVAGKECGNGLVIDHGRGWSTQYCHMQKGSLVVSPGQVVKAGEPLGKVGLSGETEVPHLHLTVRHNDVAVDPFSDGPPPGTCSQGRSLWSKAVSDSFHYLEREVINFGFAAAPVTMESVESGQAREQEPNARSDVLVAYVRAIGLKQGDEQAISVQYPDGSVLAEYRAPALQTNKAEFFVTAGLRRKDRVWPPGTYTTTFHVSNNGVEALRKTFQFTIRQ
jgi:murein DD-endopeptidase MepM/ murein hydrolase activator NlpD